MSKIFSVVEAYNGIELMECITPGFIRDADDFFCVDDMMEFYEEAIDDVEVSVSTYIFGEGESVNVDDEDMEMITDDFIAECDCIEVNKFVVKED
jgi:hypothetical protein